MTAAEDVLARLRSIAKDDADLGARFEQLTLHALRTDRTFAQQFKQVWRWMDWPGRSTADVGVDLVALNTDGGYTAIQCKCYAPTSTLTKENIDSFLATSGKEHWSRRIIVATTDLWSPNALDALRGHAVPVERILVDDLDAMTVDWSCYDPNNPEGLAATERHQLRPYQEEALSAVQSGFAQADRGKLIMACGTGKTFTALRVAEQQAGPGRSVLFLAPSIALVAQSLKEWTAECEVPVRPFAVCSDATTGNQLEGENATAFDLAVPPTTDPNVLAGVAEPSDDMTVVFSTYQSTQVVADMQAATGHVFDLVICDEAHRTAGIKSADDKDKVFGLVHEDAVIPARKRLYMTATPKLFKPVVVDAAKDNDVVIASMDDEQVFGEEFYRLGFGEAVERGLLADYRVLILTVDEASISESFQELLSSDGELSLPDVARFVGCLSALARLPGAGGAQFTDGNSPMQRAVAFWSRISESERFAEQFEKVAESYFEQLRSRGEGHPVVSVPTRHVDGPNGSAAADLIFAG